MIWDLFEDVSGWERDLSGWEHDLSGWEHDLSGCNIYQQNIFRLLKILIKVIQGVLQNRFGIKNLL